MKALPSHLTGLLCFPQTLSQAPQHKAFILATLKKLSAGCNGHRQAILLELEAELLCHGLKWSDTQTHTEYAKPVPSRHMPRWPCPSCAPSGTEKEIVPLKKVRKAWDIQTLFSNAAKKWQGETEAGRATPEAAHHWQVSQ